MIIDASYTNFPFEEVERIIGHVYNDKNLLLTAFTRSSFSNEHKSVESNEKMEFLGDSVLGLIVSEYLYKTNKTEGELTDAKKSFVSNKPLSYVCEKTGLYKYLIMGKGDKKTFSLSNKNVLEDLIEAIICSLYLDGGYNCAKKFVIENVLTENVTKVFCDNVTELKEYCEKRKIGLPEYRFFDLSGKNKPAFRTEIFLNGEYLCSAEMAGGENVSKQQASYNALTILKRKDS